MWAAAALGAGLKDDREQQLQRFLAEIAGQRAEYTLRQAGKPVRYMKMSFDRKNDRMNATVHVEEATGQNVETPEIHTYVRSADRKWFATPEYAKEEPRSQIVSLWRRDHVSGAVVCRVSDATQPREGR